MENNLKLCREIIFDNPNLFPISEQLHRTIESKVLVRDYIENCIGLTSIFQNNHNYYESIKWAAPLEEWDIIRKSFIRSILLCYTHRHPTKEQINEFNELMKNVLHHS